MEIKPIFFKLNGTGCFQLLFIGLVSPKFWIRLRSGPRRLKIQGYDSTPFLDFGYLYMTWESSYFTLTISCKLRQIPLPFRIPVSSRFRFRTGSIGLIRTRSVFLYGYVSIFVKEHCVLLDYSCTQITLFSGFYFSVLSI